MSGMPIHYETRDEHVALITIERPPRNALDMFQLDVGRYPTTEEGLQALRQRPSSAGRWSGPYLRDEVPVDPWGRPDVYRSPGEGGANFDLGSYGADGRSGGDGNNADIGVSG